MPLDNLLIIGDSLSLPNAAEQVDAALTYPTLLSKHFERATIKHSAIIGNDTKVAKGKIKEDILDFQPSHALVQLGIVDCAPRVFLRNELRFVMMLPDSVQNFIHKFTRKHRYLITKFRKREFVSIRSFEKNYRIILSAFQKVQAKVILINIVAASDYLCSISYGMRENIDTYNQVIKELAEEYGCDLINLNSLTSQNKALLANDGYHLSITGNRQISEEVTAIWH